MFQSLTYSVLESLILLSGYALFYFFSSIYPIPVSSPLFDLYIMIAGVSLLIKLKNGNQNLFFEILSKFILFYSLAKISNSKAFLFFLFGLFVFYLLNIKERNSIKSFSDLIENFKSNLRLTKLEFKRENLSVVLYYYLIISIVAVFSILKHS